MCGIPKNGGIGCGIRCLPHYLESAYSGCDAYKHEVDGTPDDFKAFTGKLAYAHINNALQEDRIILNMNIQFTELSILKTITANIYIFSECTYLQVSEDLNAFKIECSSTKLLITESGSMS